MKPDNSTANTDKVLVTVDSNQCLQLVGDGHAVPASHRSMRILQISDCHLGEQLGEKLVGMDTDASLDYVLQSIQQVRSESPVDLLVATGDLANHGTAAAYKRLHKKLLSIDIPFIWLPGNHDDLALMQAEVEAKVIPSAVLMGEWAMVMVDSTVAGKVGGTIGDDELAQLQHTLAQLPESCHIVICVHHQVLPVGSTWLDHQQITDWQALLEVLRGDTRVRVVLSGHVHQDSVQTDARLPLTAFITSPSTCIQFAPNTEDFKIDDKLPGYRWFDLHADGSFETGVNRVEAHDLTMDLSSSGY